MVREFCTTHDIRLRVTFPINKGIIIQKMICSFTDDMKKRTSVGIHPLSNLK